MLKLVIIDDEPDARSSLSALLNMFCPDVQIIGEAESVPAGVALIRNTSPEVVLLDIHLGETTGFDLLDKFANPAFHVVFTTAYDTYALKAFQYCALDYLLKPLDPDKLIQAIDKAKRSIEQEQSFQEQIRQLRQIHQMKTFDKIALPSSEGVVFINIGDILYLQSDVNYTLFYTNTDEKIVVSKTLKEFEEMLPQETFCRTHQSYIVNIHFVKKVLKEDGGYALLENGKKIPVSRRKKEAFLKMLMG